MRWSGVGSFADLALVRNEKGQHDDQVSFLFLSSCADEQSVEQLPFHWQGNRTRSCHLMIVDQRFTS